MKRGCAVGALLVTVLLGVLPGGRVAAGQARQVTCTGRVLDAGGQALAGVQVRLYQETYGTDAYYSEVTLASEAAAKADGSFSLAAPAESESRRYGTLVARKDGLAFGFATWDMSQDQTLDLTLGEAKPLAGVVADEKDQPIPEAAVSVYLLQIGDGFRQWGLSMRLAPHLLTTHTDAAGRFCFPNLPADAGADLLVRTPSRATICTYAPSMYGGPSLRYRAGQTDIRIAQPVEAKIEGVIIQKQTKQPVGGLTLRLIYAGNRPLDGHDAIAVQADGTFAALALPAGQYALQLVTPRNGLADWVAAPVPVELKAGEARAGLKIEVSKGGLLEITVTDAASNKPLEKASAGVSQSGQYVSGTSNAQGIIRLRLAPGTCQVQNIFKQGYSSTAKPQTVTIEEGTTQRLTATLQEVPKVRGIVRDPDGAPVSGARVRIMPAGYQDTISDAEGRFEIAWDRREYPTERAVFCVLARHEARNLAAVADLAEGVTARDVKLESGIALTGRVVDPNGKGIGGARVNVMLYMGGWGSSLNPGQTQTTDRSGSFEIRGAPARQRYDLYASASGYGSARSETVNTDNAATDRFDTGVLTLAPANLSVSGLVVDLQDRLVPNASVGVQSFGDGQPERVSAQTDAEGRFTLAGVCPGQLTLRVDAGQGSKRLSARVLTEGGAAGIKIIVREGQSPTQRVGGRSYEQLVSGTGRIIAGVAVDEKGQPVKGVPVKVCCHKTLREGRPTWMFSDFSALSGTTDAQGRFAIELKEDGEYNLLFSPDKLAATIVYDVPVGRKDVYVLRAWKVSHSAISETIVFDDDPSRKEVDLVVRPDPASAPPLAGGPLPGFDGIGIKLAPEQIQGKRVLVCFFDWEQRPSRNSVLQLAKQAEALRGKGIAIAAVQTTKGNDAELLKWAADNGIAFPVGSLQGDQEEVFSTWSVKSLPWLILTNAGHIITAEGFAANELDNKLAEAGKTDR
ncbi:MAG: carboxypeptidase regulatory-like domain-containing protein [Planctomycetes bacterium]|nr:carboxypeptidase regulatory-like domain-containing protein [Planctomycetota bacterium]